MWEGYDPTGTIRGIHFRVPGLEAIGVMSPSDNPVGPIANDLAAELAAHGDGAYLICIETHDLDELQRRLEVMGARLEYAAPLDVGDERLNMLSLAGTRITLAYHTPGHWERWRGGALRGAGTPPRVRTAHRVQEATVVDVAVSDVTPVTSLLDQILGPGWPTVTHDGGGEECRGLGYPLRGMKALRVLQPVLGAPPGPISRHLDRRGEGVARLTFRVVDPVAADVELRGAGIPIDNKLTTAEAITTEPICGVAFTFTSAVRD
jgi:hypothetical protein